MDDAREPAPRRGLWVVVCLVGLVALTAGALLSARPPAYASSAVVSLEPKSSSSVPPASTITLLTAPYAAYASADSTLQSVALDTGLSLDDVRGAVAVTLPAGSTNVVVDVTSDTAADAVAIAGRVASKVVTFAATDSVLRASIAIPPTTPRETLVSRAQPVLTPAALGTGAALLVLGLFMLLAPAVRRRRERPARQGAEDAERPVAAPAPDAHEDDLQPGQVGDRQGADTR